MDCVGGLGRCVAEREDPRNLCVQILYTVAARGTSAGTVVSLCSVPWRNSEYGQSL